MTVNLHSVYIVKEGYLTKSPPLDEPTLIRRRWRMRWFVLYNEPDVEVALYYFGNEQSVNNNKPKGKISLVGATVYKQRGRLHGYSYVINIATENRLYHLCSTQQSLHEDWLEKIRDNHIPNTEYPPDCLRGPRIPKHYLRHCPLCADSTIFISPDQPLHDSEILRDNSTRQPPKDRPILRESNPPFLTEFSLTIDLHRNSSVVSNTSVKSKSDEECDYGDTSYVNTPIHPAPPIDDPLLFTPYDEYEDPDDPYVTMYPDIVKRVHKVESEDEGFGRSGSDSSNASSTITSTNTPPMTAYTMKPAMLRPRWERNSKDNILLEGFVGPKLIPSRTTNLHKTRSMGDINFRISSPSSSSVKFDAHF